MQNNETEQQQPTNLINFESEHHHPNAANNQQSLQQNSQQQVEDQQSHVPINQNTQDENQQKSLERTYGLTVVINEQDQQEDQHQLNPYDVYDKQDDDVDTYVFDKEEQEFQYNIKQLIQADHDNESKCVLIFKKEKKEILQIIHQMFLDKKQFIQTYRKASPLSQILNQGIYNLDILKQMYGNKLDDEIKYYDYKLGKDGIMFYVNQNKVHYQKWISKHRIKIIYLKASKQ